MLSRVELLNAFRICGLVMIHKIDYLFKFGFIYRCLGFCLVCLWDACVSEGYCFYIGELCVCLYWRVCVCVCVVYMCFLYWRDVSLCVFVLFFVCFNNVKTVKEH